MKTNIVWHNHTITRQDREKLHNHKSAVIWFTGLSGAGKSTLANLLEQVLYYQYHINTYVLDGDNLRYGICYDLDFSESDRQKNIRRIGEIAKLMFDAGIVVLTACISPHRIERQIVRNMLPIGSFIEVFIDTPLSVCENRDPKGLYKKARNGKLNNFTGIDAIYDIPLQPDLKLNGEEPPTNLVNYVLKLLIKRNIIYTKIK